MLVPRGHTTESAPHTHRDAGAEAGAGLRAGSADVVAHGRVLVAGSVQVSHRAWTVGAGEAARPGRVGACTQTQRGEGVAGTAAQRQTAKRSDASRGCKSCESKKNT